MCCDKDSIGVMKILYPFLITDQVLVQSLNPAIDGSFTFQRYLGDFIELYLMFFLKKIQRVCHPIYEPGTGPCRLASQRAQDGTGKPSMDPNDDYSLATPEDVHDLPSTDHIPRSWESFIVR
jgi:hypothetical protein